MSEKRKSKKESNDFKKESMSSRRIRMKTWKIEDTKRRKANR